MRQSFLFIFLFSFFSVSAQVTPNPSIRKKSTSDVYINKLEITDTETIVSMQYVSKSAEDELKEYFKKNPDEKDQFRSLSPMVQRMLLQEFMLQGKSSTISFQPGSFIRTNDGQKYKFLRAVSIPTAPNRKDVEPGKKYFFKVYFEKIAPGYEVVDLVESSKESDNNLTYWNFYGIKINNPKDGNKRALAAKPNVKEEIAEEEALSQEFRFYGRVKDIDTQQAIQAKVLCIDPKTNEIIDSVITSRSGSFEFLVPQSDLVFQVISDGYNEMEEVVTSSVLKSKSEYQKDFYLEQIYEKPVVKVEEKQAEVKDELPIKKEIGEQLTEDAFKLDKVYFDLGDARVLPESYDQLDNLAEHLKENPELQIQIEGHTDNQGDPKANKRLSYDRAFNVREYLIKKGIAGDRIKFIGLGDTQPVAKNNDEESRQKNRRVEYKILK